MIPFSKANSILYYPASGTDVNLIDFLIDEKSSWNRIFDCFICVDINIDESQFQDFYGNFSYDTSLIEVVKVSFNDLYPTSKRIEPKHFYAKMFTVPLNSFKYNFVFIRDDGVYAYQDLFHDRDIVPKGIAIIQPGEGYGGGNRTNYYKSNDELGLAIRKQLVGSIDVFFFIGGYGKKYGLNHLPLESSEYNISRKVVILDYYKSKSMFKKDGEVSVFRIKEKNIILK